jgi:hypothetical protein
LIKLVSVLVCLLAMLVTYRLIALTRDGGMFWLVLDGSAELVEDGTQVEGWLHHEWKDRFLIVTRKAGPAGRESYFVSPVGRRGPFVEGCDGWTAMNMPVLPFVVAVYDAVFCPDWRLPDHPVLYGNAFVNSHSVEFEDERGKRLRVQWKEDKYFESR